MEAVMTLVMLVGLSGDPIPPEHRQVEHIHFMNGTDCLRIGRIIDPNGRDPDLRERAIWSCKEVDLSASEGG